MIKRKILTVLLATPLSLLFIFAVFFGEWEQPLDLIVMTGVFSLWVSPITLLYGLPVSFLSDFVGKRLQGRVRSLTALFVHLFFAVLFGFIVPMNGSLPIFSGEVDFSVIFATIVALFFWIVDEWLRKRKMRKLRS